MPGINLLATIKGSLLEDFFPKGWDLQRIDACCTMMGHEIAMEIRNTKEEGKQIVFILPVGPMGMYRWVVYFLTQWNIDCSHVYGFNMDEWSDSQGNTLPSTNPGAFQYAMENALYKPLGKLTVPEKQRHFATKDALPHFRDQIFSLKQKGARLVVVYGIGRVFHIAFWEPHFAGEFSSEEEWKEQSYRIAAKLHPMTIEQNAVTSFKSRTTLVSARANTIGPGLFLSADYAIGGAEGVFGRGMQWQGMSLWVTLRYGPDMWVPSSFMSTRPGTLYFEETLAGPLEPELN
jgi:glucosamine-6-phosphate deaminase